MRKEFEMSQEQFDKILEASRSVPAIALHCGPISSPQENANLAWKSLGVEMGFDGMTVQPTGKGNLFFTAEPRESGDQTCESE